LGKKALKEWSAKTDFDKIPESAPKLREADFRSKNKKKQ
jgi:hypothetical protein